MPATIELDNASDAEIPSEEQFSHWVELALKGRREDGEISIRVVDENEIATLNETYRGKSKPTNVLSFPADLPEELQLPLLGDIAICAAVVEREAVEQQKPPESHWAHMVIHGTLHLLGYDHIEDDEAEIMEGLEIELLSTLGIPDPYQLNQQPGG